MTFLDFLGIAAILATFISFIWMSIIDLKYRILPDVLNLTVALCGIAFHMATEFRYITWEMMLLGALVGGGLLLLIRAAANWHYGMDTLGLGDVKLLAAGGIWLGPQDLMMALSAGAFAGLCHGLGYIAYMKIVKNEKVAFRGLTIPAGPGFIVGLLIVGIWKFWSYGSYLGL